MSNMEREFIPYQEALELKELGFDEPCFGFYIASQLVVTSDTVYNSSDIPVCKAPLYQQTFRWFREKYNLFGQVNIHTYFIYKISNDKFEMIKQYDKLTNTYEEAELACLRKLIEIVKGGDK